MDAPISGTIFEERHAREVRLACGWKGLGLIRIQISQTRFRHPLLSSGEKVAMSSEVLAESIVGQLGCGGFPIYGDKPLAAGEH